MLPRTSPRSLKSVLEATVEYKQVYVQSGVNKKRMGDGESKDPKFKFGQLSTLLKEGGPGF